MAVWHGAPPVVGARIRVASPSENSCTSYWITLTDYLPRFNKTKWCMPRDEVKKDRADDFLAELIADRTATTNSWCSLISIIFGISPLASVGYTKDILRSRRNAKCD